MKKTLISALLMGCVAYAEAVDVTLTTGISISKDGEGTTVISALNSDYSNYNNSLPTSVGMNYAMRPGGNSGKICGEDGISFTVTLNQLYNADTIHPDAAITLNSFSYLVGDQVWCQDGNRSVTVAVARTGESVSGMLKNLNELPWITLNTSDLKVTMSDTLTVTISTTSPTTEGLNLDVIDVYGKQGYTVVCTGVSTEKTGANIHFKDSWSAEAPLVKLSVTATPEPATATLSLLALAGLAARRRRH